MRSSSSATCAGEGPCCSSTEMARRGRPIQPRESGPRGRRMVASCAHRADRRTAGSEAAARTRARCARSTGTRLLASREAQRSRSSWASRSGGAVHPSIGTLRTYLESGSLPTRLPCVAAILPRRGQASAVRRAGTRRTADRRTTARSSRGRTSMILLVAKGSGGLAAPALASRYVAVHGFVLPAELPLVVSRELGAASSFCADPIACVLPVGPRERADRCAPVPLLCHVAHILSDGTGGREGVAAPLCTLFEHHAAPVHSGW